MLAAATLTAPASVSVPAPVALTPTITLPELADGWSAECRAIISGAYYWSLDIPESRLAEYCGEVPYLWLDDILHAAANVDVLRTDLTPRMMLAAIQEAMRFAELDMDQD